MIKSLAFFLVIAVPAALLAAVLVARLAARRRRERLASGERPLAVTFVGSRGIPATWGGVEHYVEAVATRLAARGHHVSVYCRSHYTTARGSHRGVELRHVPSLHTKHLEAISHTLFATLHLLLRRDDVVHYQALGPSLLCWIPRLFGRWTVVTVQGLDHRRAKWGPAARAVLRLGEWTSARLPHRTVVVSRALEHHYARRHGAGTGVYIPNGVDVASVEDAAAPRRASAPRDGYLLAVGRLVPEKGFHTLIRAYRRLGAPRRLVIAGEASYTDDYAHSLRELAEGLPVAFPGWVYAEDLEELYRGAYLFVSASEVEGLPLTLIEAMSMGCPVLASDIAPHVEVLAGHGFHFRSGDEADLAARLEELLADPERVADSREPLVRRARTAYDWERIVDATEDLYRGLAAGREGER